IGEKGLEMIAKFHNLRDINLNDTPVDDQGLAGLTKLEKLRAASLSGTAVTATGLKVLLENPGLQKIYVWNTAMTQEEATQLMAAFPAKTIELGFIDGGQTILSLTVPQVTPTRTFFRDDLEV